MTTSHAAESKIIPMTGWHRWFAWHPVRLLTMEWAWLRFVERRPAISGDWSYGRYDYSNP